MTASFIVHIDESSDGESVFLLNERVGPRCLAPCAATAKAQAAFAALLAWAFGRR